MAAPLRAQQRQHGLDYRQGAEEISLEVPAGSLDIGFLDHSDLAISSVADNDVETPKVLKTALDGRGHCRGIGDVERQRQYGIAISANEVGKRLGLAGSRNDLVAAFKRCFGPDPAEAARRASDEPDLALRHDTFSVLHSLQIYSCNRLPWPASSRAESVLRPCAPAPPQTRCRCLNP